MPDTQVAAFYQFFQFPAPGAARQPLHGALKELGVKGSVLLASEGVNGTIAAEPLRVAEAIDCIARICGAGQLDCKLSTSVEPPFKRLKVRLKREIVTMGAAVDPSRHAGTYVSPHEWNALISEPGVTVIDTRNSYEHRIGTFAGAIDPATASFGEFPDFAAHRMNLPKTAKIAMFCTGGIRCEKSTSYLKSLGYENVFHLKGGILKYLEEVPRDQSLWRGDCFVFDERVAVTHGLAPGEHTMCHGCLEPVSAGERTSALFEEGVQCPRCANSLSEAQKASNRERQRQFELAKARGRQHLGPEAGGER